MVFLSVFFLNHKSIFQELFEKLKDENILKEKHIISQLVECQSLRINQVCIVTAKAAELAAALPAERKDKNGTRID